MVSTTDIEERVQFWPSAAEPLTLPELRPVTVANRRVEVEDQIGARKFYPGDCFVLAAVIDNGRYALVVDTRRTGTDLQWTDSVFLVASASLRPMPA